MPEINYDHKSIANGRIPPIRKLGAVNRNGGVSPFVWNNRLMRMELIEDKSGARAGIRDCETGEFVSFVDSGRSFYSCFAEEDAVYIACVQQNQKDTVYIHESHDLIHWEKRMLLQNPGWDYFNTSLTKGPDGYVIALEARSPTIYVGKYPNTLFFATSPDLHNWTFMDYHNGYPLDRYTGIPWLHYCEGWYYLIATELLPLQRYANYIYRTKDFITWHVGFQNPILIPSSEDREISPRSTEIDPSFLEEIRTRVIAGVYDIHMCNWNGKSYINYNACDLLGYYFMAEAECESSVEQLLASYF